MREEFDTDTPYINSPVPEGVRRLAVRVKEMYDSEEFQAFWQPAKTAILHDDEDGVYVWAETRIGRKPDFVIKVSYLGKKELGDATPRETWVLVDDRGEKLTGEARGEPDDEGIAVFEGKTKAFGRLKRVRDEFTDPDEWKQEIAKAILIAGAESPHGYPLTLSAVEHRIVRDDPRRGGITNLPGEGSSIVRNLRIQAETAEARATKGDLGPQEHAEAMRASERAEDELERVRGLRARRAARGRRCTSCGRVARITANPRRWISAPIAAWRGSTTISKLPGRTPNDRTRTPARKARGERVRCVPRYPGDRL